jgi:erythromycin esterase-like protein
LICINDRNVVLLAPANWQMPPPDGAAATPTASLKQVDGRAQIHVSAGKELTSHHFQAILREQFDEHIWFDQTKAVTPFETKPMEEMPDTYPFGL